MINLLQGIVDWFVCWIKTGAIMAFNLIIEGIGLAIAAVLGLLPPMPALPSVPEDVTDAFAYGAYWFPVDYLLTTFTLVFSLWLVWQAVAIPLRWAKADPGQ